MDFNTAFERVVGTEGGYVNDPRDPGGETKFGISKRSYPDEDIAGMTLNRAKDIYRRDFWEVARLDVMPEDVRFAVFDLAVNSGVVPAITMLQRAVGVNDDGILGPRTLAAVNATPASRVIARLCAERLRLMTDLKTFDTYGRGWTRRVLKILQEA
jgi:lysozyme family protein